MSDHVARLHEVSAALAIVLPLSDRDLLAGLAELIRADDLDDAAVRITVSRGPASGRGLLPADWRALAPTVVIAAWPTLSATVRTTILQLIATEEVRSWLQS